jgi:hypothetical protein
MRQGRGDTREFVSRTRGLSQATRRAVFSVWAERLETIYRSLIPDDRVHMMREAVTLLADSAAGELQARALAARWEGVCEFEQERTGSVALVSCYSFFSFALAQTYDEGYAGAAEGYVEQAFSYLMPPWNVTIDLSSGLTIIEPGETEAGHDSAWVAREIQFLWCTLELAERMESEGTAVRPGLLRQDCWGGGPGPLDFVPPVPR